VVDERGQQQERLFRDHLHASDARETCPSCDAGRYTVEASPPWLARVCAQCGAVLLYDPRPLGFEVRWTLGPEGTKAIAALISDLRRYDLIANWPLVPPYEGETRITD
jgi:hypothetical protein